MFSETNNGRLQNFYNYSSSMNKKIQKIKTTDCHRFYADLLEKKCLEKKKVRGIIMKKKNLFYKDMEFLNQLNFGIPDKNRALQKKIIV
ncbi:hypothetical protein [Chryseobacterium sp.]|uniref:hypothetical protein n=1 Tax=Chryseobacterium sp. TaxID=1871047 RepID=UPI0035C785C5